MKWEISGCRDESVPIDPLPGPDEFDERGIRIIDKLKFFPDSPYFKR